MNKNNDEFSELCDEESLPDNLFFAFVNLLRERTGIALKDYKKYLVINRLSRVVGEGMPFANFRDYYRALTSDPTGELIEQFTNLLTTNYSYFFREPIHFDVLQTYLDALKDRDDYVRIWSAACSTGEEPYSIAITALRNYLRKWPYVDFRILATDISTRVLGTAARGVYPGSKLAGHMPLSDVDLYFDDIGAGNFKVKDTVVKNVAFRYLNLLGNYPFKKKFDVVFLRNVLIYFANKEKEDVIDSVSAILKRGGLLIIGLSESLVGIRHNLTMTRNSVYINDK